MCFVAHKFAKKSDEPSVLHEPTKFGRRPNWNHHEKCNIGCLQQIDQLLVGQIVFCQIPTCSLVLHNIFVKCYSCWTANVCRDAVIIMVLWYQRGSLLWCVYGGQTMLQKYLIQCINVEMHRDDWQLYTKAWHCVMSHHWKFVSSKAHTPPSLQRCLIRLKSFHFCAQAN
jgi:hypothetical protein